MMIMINEIFKSVSGEAGHPYFPQGTFCAFIRFQGCNLRCEWPCDTVCSQEYGIGGMYMRTADIIQAVDGSRNVMITGGEPLLQRTELVHLVNALRGIGKQIQIETNGTYAPPDFGPAVTWVIDYKLPSSGMEFAMMKKEDFISALATGRAVIKFVYDDDADIERAISRIKVFTCVDKAKWSLNFAPFILSPTINGRAFSKKLMEKIYAENLQDYCIFSLQSHTILDLK